MSSTSIYGCSTAIGNDQKFHYVYRITNLVENKHYYGVRSCSVNPYTDIGKKYFTSSKVVKPIFKENPEIFKIKIIGCYTNREDALIMEVKIHNKFNVAKNNKFYNKSKQKSTGFDTTGFVTVLDCNNKIFSVSVNDPRYISGELIHNFTGRILVKDKNGFTSSVKNNDSRLLSGELLPINSGKIYITDGCKNKLHDKNKDIPINWGKGMTKTKTNLMWITNGVENKLIEKTRTIDSGWSNGRTSDMKNRIWITNGIKNRRILTGTAVPKNWWCGMSAVK